MTSNRRVVESAAHLVIGGVVPGADTINYTYDAIGNLVSDAAESIGTIDWLVNGKIRAINRSITPTQSQPNLKFDYGPDGQRIRKAVTWSTGGDTTWYVRDAQGNTMAVYLQRNDNIFAQEHYMYGSSRLGSSAQWTYVSSLTPHADTNRFARVLGQKNYELANHLGNVLTTISDQKKAIQDGTTGTIAHWTADVVSYSDYYPFGMMMVGRNGSVGDYRYGFNGMEKDDEVKGTGNSHTTEYRQYDSRIARWTSIDPLTAKYPSQSSYVAFNNNPLYFNDPTGLEGDPPDLTKQQQRRVNKFKRKERRMAKKTGLDIGSDVLRDQMEEKYNDKKWIWMEANNQNVNAGFSWQNVRDLADVADGKGEVYYEFEFTHIDLGDDWPRTTDASGAQIFSIPIVGSGSVQLTTTFTGSDQSVDIGMFQSNVQFGTERTLFNNTLTPGNNSTGQRLTNPTGGSLLTLRIANSNFGGGNTGMTHSLSVATTNRPIQKTRLMRPTTHYVMQSTNSSARPNLHKALPALIEARGRGRP